MEHRREENKKLKPEEERHTSFLKSMNISEGRDIELQSITLILINSHDKVSDFLHALAKLSDVNEVEKLYISYQLGRILNH